MPKAKYSKLSRGQMRHNPLSEDLDPTNPYKQKNPKKRRSNGKEIGEDYVESNASRKILKIGQDLIEEVEADEDSQKPSEPNKAFLFESRWPGLGAVQEHKEEEIGEYDEAPGEDDAWGDEEEEEVLEVDELSPEDQRAFNKFMTTDDDPIQWPGQEKEETQKEGEGTNLADLILQRIAEFEAKAKATQNPEDALEEEEDEGPAELPEKVVEVYTKIGFLLSRYRSGPLPKPFKIIPTLPMPTQHAVLPITRPDKWTPAAIYQATRIFVSSSSPLAQSFLHAILLPRVRDDIRDNRILNVHMYNALKKSLYKPAAFFKGILFPLMEESCSLREAHILGSVIARVSVPVLHSAAALQRLCEIAADQMRIDPTAAASANVFIRTLLEKKYALPYKVIDALVFHFLRFKNIDLADTHMVMNADEGNTTLPVIWHQCFLAFAQRYKNEIAEDQREALLDLLLVKGHKQITPEIRRELLAGRGRGIPAPEPTAEGVAMGNGGDDTMVIAMDAMQTNGGDDTMVMG
ncbi:Bystin-domain-containing protein [Aulographum hederae CBS 113979]|uniref:Bystin-domain-containing protein n=1 Tax=Aulographum hederae CBS 113979 TaxID=1176131 RepID=A0A6G1H058_9PEZI|nr:Bystin-domain-containing protein [Aulographum hederae CBS 113979]